MTIDTIDKKIKICSDVLRMIYQSIQFHDDASEAGGILIGRENSINKNLIIEHITRPFDADKQGRGKFLRKDKQHIQVYQDLYANSNGIYAYVGEWHTHPESSPNYSATDIRNWKKIGKVMKGGTQYHVIAGIKEICIWEYDAGSGCVNKIGNAEWEGIF